MKLILIYFLFLAGTGVWVIRKKKNREIAGIIMAGSLVGLLASSYHLLCKETEPLKQIQREQKNGKSRQIEVLASLEEGEEPVQIQISPQTFSKEELKLMCENVIPLLEEMALNQNTSWERIEKDLYFPERADGYPFSFQWETDNREVLSFQGKIAENVPEEGTLVKITVSISDEDSLIKEDHSFYAVVFPKDKEKAFFTRLGEMLSQQEKQTRNGDSYILPDEFEGKKITFYPVKNDNSFMIFSLFLLASVFTFAEKKERAKKRQKEKKAAMEKEYAKMVSRMAMLTGAGLTISGAFRRIARVYSEKKENKENPLYEEIMIACREMESGISEYRAYQKLGERCAIPCMIRFTTLLIQYTKSGSGGLKAALREETDKALQERKDRAKKLGEEAGTKLLFPMTLMLVLVMAVIMIPAFTSFGL